MTQTAPIRPSAVSVTPSVRAVAAVIRLNAFQLLMRRWTSLAPYNAGQMMRVTGEPDLERWRSAVETVVAQMGLGVPRFTDGDANVTFGPAGFISIERYEGKQSALFNEELNRRFKAEEFPIRFFALAGEDGTHHFVAVYDHWIADSRAMREMMHRIFQRYQSPEVAGGQLPPLKLESPPFNKLFRKYIGWLPRSSAVLQSFYNIVRHRRVYRINLPLPGDFTSRVIIRQLPEGLIQRVHAHARKHDGSVNDVFLAALAQTMGEHTARSRYRRRRRIYRLRRERVGLGTIVDIRDAASQPLDDVFGLYLSSYTVAICEPETRELDSLVDEIARRTRQIKQRRTAVRSFQAFVMARWWWDYLLRKQDRVLFFQKTVPLAAGISNVNMTGTWADPAGHSAQETENGEHPIVLDYVRISPTGPLLPLVFTLTTVGSRLCLCVTYRTIAFTAEQAEGIVSDFVDRLTKVK